MHQESGGVEVFVEPFVNQNKIKKYFGTNLITKGIFPVYVKIANKSKDTSFFVNENTFSLVVGTDNYNALEIDEIKSVSGGLGVSQVGACCLCLCHDKTALSLRNRPAKKIRLGSAHGFHECIPAQSAFQALKMRLIGTVEGG